MGIRHNLFCIQGSQNLEEKINRSLLSHNLQPDSLSSMPYNMKEVFMHISLEIIYTIQRFHCITPKETGRIRRQNSGTDVQCSVI